MPDESLKPADDNGVAAAPQSPAEFTKFVNAETATWKKGLAQLREAGQAAYNAAQAKNQDQVVDAAEKITTACSTCHDPFREKTPRCTP